jgi:hypothetical protein
MIDGSVLMRLSDGRERRVSTRDLVLINRLMLANRPTFSVRIPDRRDAARLYRVQRIPGKGEGVRVNVTHVTFPIALGIMCADIAETDRVTRKGRATGAVQVIRGTRRSRRTQHRWPGMYCGVKPGVVVEVEASGGSAGRRRQNFCIGKHWVYKCNAPSDGEDATHRFRKHRNGRTFELYLLPLRPLLMRNAEVTVDYDWRNLGTLMNPSIVTRQST